MLNCIYVFCVKMNAVMDPPCATCGAVRCQKDRKFFIDLPDDFRTRTVRFISTCSSYIAFFIMFNKSWTSFAQVIPCGYRSNLLDKFIESIEIPCQIHCKFMKMQTTETFLCLVTNEANRTYLGCDAWRALADACGMEAGERVTFYLDYDSPDVMVYCNPAGSSGIVTSDYSPQSNSRRVD